MEVVDSWNADYTAPLDKPKLGKKLYSSPCDNYFYALILCYHALFLYDKIFNIFTEAIHPRSYGRQTLILKSFFVSLTDIWLL